VVSALQIALLAYVGYGVLLYALQRPLMYPGTRVPPSGNVPEDAVTLPVAVSVGTVEAWWFGATGPGAMPALIMAHGNAELIEDNVVLARRLRDSGIGVLLVEYPGFGNSEGSPTRASIGEALTAAYDRLVARPDVDSARIVGMGRSLGGGAITDLATARGLRALVLQSTFTSVSSMVLRGYGVPGFLVKDDFDNAAVLASWEGPALVFHGRDDRIIPFHHGERLAAVREGIRLVPLECGHNDCAWTGSAVLREMREFLEEAGVLER